MFKYRRVRGPSREAEQVLLPSTDEGRGESRCNDSPLLPELGEKSSQIEA